MKKFILFLLYLYLLIDIINGYLLNHNYPSLSLYFKSFTLLLIIIYLIFYKQFLVILANVTILMIILLSHFIMSGDLIVSLKGMDWMIKFLSIVIYFLFFKYLIENNGAHNIYLFIKISFILLCFNFLLAIVGLGYPMYAAENIGHKGFIYAGNEIGAVLIITGAFMLMYYLEQKKYLAYMGISIIILIISAMLTSKVSILGSLLIIFIFPFISFAKQLNNYQLPKKSFMFTSMIIIVIPLLFMGVLYYALFISNLIERLSFHYDKVDIITLILSHRNVWAEEAWHVYLNQYTLLEQIFGTGKEWYIYMSNEGMVEIDPIDFLMSYGLVGVFAIAISLTYIMFLLHHTKSSNMYHPYILFIYILLLLLSMTSGHIFNSGIAGALIAAILALSIYKRTKVTI